MGHEPRLEDARLAIVRLHTNDRGVWFLTRCHGCGDVGKHAAMSARARPVQCPHCEIWLDLRSATVAPRSSPAAATRDRSPV